ncbi:MAG: hypothetical protein LBU29_02210 [Endomicrobium sp.]|jgi:hypothetical protein|nr:hypothetical protein [Endomicrobium sp.]
MLLGFLFLLLCCCQLFSQDNCKTSDGKVLDDNAEFKRDCEIDLTTNKDGVESKEKEEACNHKNNVKIDSSKSDSFTISSAYFDPGLYTNSQLANFGLDLIKVETRIGQRIKNQWVKIPYAIICCWVNCVFSLSFHEIGHALRGKAFGCDYMMPKDCAVNNSDDLGPFKVDQNFFKFFLKKLVRPHRGYPIRVDKKLSLHESLICSAGGLNNQIYFTERISNELHKKGNISGSGNYAFAYVWGKLYTISYEASKTSKDSDILIDSERIENIYKKMGISVKKRDIVFANVVSTLLSGTTYSVIARFFDWSDYTDYNNLKALKIAGFRVPDTFSYITTRGVSYKVVSGYKVRENLDLMFGVEQVIHGKSATEVNLGVSKTFGAKLNHISCELAMTFGRGFNIEATCSVPTIKDWFLNFGIASYCCKSLLGERHAMDMRNGKDRSNNAFVSISYRY